jgi:hypothetical protein
MKKIMFVAAMMVASLTAFGQTTTVDWGNWEESGFEVKNLAGGLLTAGGIGDGDGAVIQLGYYTGGSTSSTGSNFAGTWVALTGEGGLNSAYSTTSIGDNFGVSGPLGQYGFSTVFDQTGGSSTGGGLSGLTTSIPLSIRFYSGTTIASSTHYNTVSSDNWGWVTPSGPGSLMSLTINSSTLASLVWEDSTSAFKTSIPLAAIPEPSTYAMLGMGLLGLIAYRRRS